MSKTKTKRYLVLLAAIGLVAAALGGTGTFASFNAEVTNAGNYFATGTLLLSNKTPSGTECFSNGGVSGNANAACDIVVSGFNLLPGATALEGAVTIKNTGTIDASDLKLSNAACTPHVDTSTTPSGFNTGNLCDAVMMYVQEWTVSVGGTHAYCWFGVGVTTTTCDTSFTGADSTDSINAFHTAFPASGTDLSPAPSPLTGPLSSLTSRYFTIGLYLPSAGAGDNVFQGLRATFPLTWHIDS